MRQPPPERSRPSAAVERRLCPTSTSRPPAPLLQGPPRPQPRAPSGPEHHAIAPPSRLLPSPLSRRLDRAPQVPCLQRRRTLEQTWWHHPPLNPAIFSLLSGSLHLSSFVVLQRPPHGSLWPSSPRRQLPRRPAASRACHPVPCLAAAAASLPWPSPSSPRTRGACAGEPSPKTTVAAISPGNTTVRQERLGFSPSSTTVAPQNAKYPQRTRQDPHARLRPAMRQVHLPTTLERVKYHYRQYLFARPSPSMTSLYDYFRGRRPVYNYRRRERLLPLLPLRTRTAPRMHLEGITAETMTRGRKHVLSGMHV